MSLLVVLDTSEWSERLIAGEDEGLLGAAQNVCTRLELETEKLSTHVIVVNRLYSPFRIRTIDRALHHTMRLGKFGCLAELAHKTAVLTVAYCMPAYALAPEQLLVRMYETHVSGCFYVTLASGIPAAMAPEFYHPSVLSMLGDAEATIHSSNLMSLLQYIQLNRAKSHEMMIRPQSVHTYDVRSRATVRHWLPDLDIWSKAHCRRLAELFCRVPSKSVSSKDIAAQWGQKALGEYVALETPHVQSECASGVARIPLLANDRATEEIPSSIYAILERHPQSDIDLLTNRPDVTRWTQPYHNIHPAYLESSLRSANRALFVEVRDYLSQHKPPVLYVTGLPSLPVLYAAESLGIPVRSYFSNLNDKGYVDHLCFVQEFFTVSRHVMEVLERSGAPSERITLIKRLVLNKVVAKARVALIGTAHRNRGPLVYVDSPFDRSSRHDVLITSFTALLDVIPDVQFVIKGDLVSPEYYDGVQLELRRRERLRLALCSEDESNRVSYSDANVVVSLGDNGLPNQATVLATCYRKAVVVGEGSVISQFLENGVSGVIIHSNAASILTVKLIELLMNEERSSLIGVNAQRVIHPYLS